MSINPLNDISRVYLEQIASEAFVDPEQGEAPSGRSPLQNVSDHPKASVRKKAVGAFKKQMGKEYGGTWKSRTKDPVAEAAKPDYLDFDKDGNEKESMKKALKDKAKQKVEEAKKPNDGNLANNYPPYDKVTRGDVIAGATGKDQMGGKKKSVKEGYSNWRSDLREIVDVVTKEKNDQKITEKSINNKIKINPTLNMGDRLSGGVRESVENLGGTLLEMVEIENIESIFDDLSESEIFLLSDDLIEEVVEEFFYECIEEGYDLEYVENTLVESIEFSAALLNEAKVTLGHDTKIKSDRLEKVKTAVKKVGKAVAHGAGYAAGAAVRGAKAVGREFSKGYAKGRGGSSSQASAPSSSSSSSSSGSSTGSSRPGLLGRIGSALKSGLKRAVAKGARAVSRGARNVARRMEGGEKKEAPKAAPKKTEKPSDPWEGSATTPPKAKKTKAPAKKRKTSKLDALLADVRKEEIEIEEGMTMKDFKANRKKNERRAASADAEKRGHVERTWGTGRKYSSDEAKSRREKMSDLDRSQRYRVANDPDSEHDDYPSQKTKNPKKLRKQKAMGELGENYLDEKTLTSAETKEKERIVKSMKSRAADFEKRYPGRGKEVMYATATKMAKKIAEQAMEIQPKTEKQDQAQKKISQQQDRMKQQEVQILQRKLQAIRSAPKGVDPSIMAGYEPEGEVVEAHRPPFGWKSYGPTDDDKKPTVKIPPEGVMQGGWLKKEKDKKN